MEREQGVRSTRGRRGMSDHWGMNGVRPDADALPRGWTGTAMAELIIFYNNRQEYYSEIQYCV